jgi:cytochrome c556
MAFSLAAIASEVPPPEYAKSMRAMNDAAMSLQENIDKKNWTGIAKDAASLKALTTTTEVFWQKRKVDDAIQFSKAARKAAVDVETAAKGKDEAGVKAAARGFTAACNGCHKAHRERTPEGTFSIK